MKHFQTLFMSSVLVFVTALHVMTVRVYKLTTEVLQERIRNLETEVQDVSKQNQQLKNDKAEIQRLCTAKQIRIEWLIEHLENN